MIKMLLIVIFLFFYLWLPFNIINIWANIDIQIWNHEYISTIYPIALWFAYLHSVVTPIIYILMNPRFRGCAKPVLARIFNRSNPERNNRDFQLLKENYLPEIKEMFLKRYTTIRRISSSSRRTTFTVSTDRASSFNRGEVQKETNSMIAAAEESDSNNSPV